MSASAVVVYSFTLQTFIVVFKHFLTKQTVQATFNFLKLCPKTLDKNTANIYFGTSFYMILLKKK